MRIDKFLNAVNITKRRAIAQDMIENKVIKIAGVPVKASRNVKIGDVIEITYLEKSRLFEVLQIPSQKTIKKEESPLYYKELQKPN
ncbi:RNA-binding S4 domain-containing protein [Helicobacter mesocricetorum]|uniref:RNA-binding S4 domain-containing protein n=1 Tax=Helicobacter mesocricetorum TaxID=87012 RepID=UPI000CF08364|nr:RNA-binding S4 domain-containing protein [Helicobacter mesocricetorum]